MRASGMLCSTMTKPIVRSPAAMLDRVRQECARHEDLWVFGYASLIWRPEFEFVEHRPARLHGWHRSFWMRSRVNRGTPEQPGLVFALLSGGSCQGMAFRIHRDRVQHELTRLWAREMPTGVYDPRWLPCRTARGPIRALGFTLSRRSPSFTGRLPDAELLQILRQASGRYGTTLDYMLHTAVALHERGMLDRELARLVALAKSSGLA
jgi:glutathione-specific gamma-glutamylcyclotransferase